MEYDDKYIDQADDPSFYRDSFGERITRDDDNAMADDDLTRDDPQDTADNSEDLDTAEGDTNLGAASEQEFHERLDPDDAPGGLDRDNEAAQSNDTSEAASDQPSDERGIGDKIRDKFNNMSGDDEG